MGKTTVLQTTARLSLPGAPRQRLQPQTVLQALALVGYPTTHPACWPLAAALLAAALLAQPVAAQSQPQTPAPAAAAAPATAPASRSLVQPSPQAGSPQPATLAPGGRAPARPAVGCLIGPEAVADIGTAVTGVVTAVMVDRGDSVRSGQVLVQLENEVEKSNFEAARSRATLDADVRAAEANLVLAGQRLVRAAGLVKDGFASPQTLEQAQTERDVAEQRLLQARAQKTINAHELGLVRAQLGLRTLKSPINGVVVERFVSPGERAEDKPLLRVAQLDPLRVELVMPAHRWGSVAPGDHVALQPELPQASLVQARVTHIDKMIDAASNTFRVRLTLPNPGHQLPAGARCRVEGPLALGVASSVPPTGAPGSVPPPPGAVLLPSSLPLPAPPARPRI